MKRLIAIAMGLMMFSVIATGCTDAEEKNIGEDPVLEETEETEGTEENDNSSEDQETTENQEGDDSSEEYMDENISKVYLPNRDATGLVEVEIESEEDKTLEESIVEELKQERSEEVDYTRAIREDIEVKSVVVEGDTAIVDFSSENLTGGSTEEIFMIDSIVKSLTSLEGIEKVQFLVDGEEAETLMGHMSIVDPYTAEDVSSELE